MSRVWLKYNDNAAWQEVVTDNAEDVRFNFVLDNLDNPTNYVSESSYSLRLPRCAENNRFFGQFCHLDSVIVAGGYDPTHKMQYMCMDSAGLLISTGDAVLNEINADGYVLALVGSQARLFCRLLNAGYDSTRAAEDSTYYLMTDWLKRRKVGSLLVADTNTIDAATVYTSWRVDNPIFDFSALFSTADLKAAYGLSLDTTVTETAAFIASLVGFAPTAQGRYKDFESDKWVEVGIFKMTLPPPIGDVVYRPYAVYPTGFTYLPVLCSTRNFMNEPNNPIDVGDGLVELQLNEFRSYYQQPFVYVSALWQLVREAFPAITGGYTLNLDARWFNAGNSEINRLVYMLPSLYSERGAALSSVDVAASDTVNYGASGTTTDSPAHVLAGGGAVVEINNITTISKTQRAEFSGYISLSYALAIDASGFTPVCYFAPCNAIQVTVGLHRNGTYYQKFYAICPIPTDGKITEDDYWNMTELSLYQNVALGYEVVFPKYTPMAYEAIGNTLLWELQETLGSAFEGTATDEVQEMYIDYGTMNDYNFFMHFEGSTRKYDAIPPRFAFSIEGSVSVYKQTRSGAELSLERLFGDIKPAEVLMQYSKSRQLLWHVDDNTRTVTVLRASDYYADRAATVTDLTENIDKGRGFTVRPLSWDTRRVLLNMNGIDADYIEGYADKYGREYGTMEIVTANALNDDEKRLLGSSATDTVNTSAMLSEVLLTRDSLLQSKQDYKDMPAMPLNIADGESANVSGNFYYRHDNAAWKDNPSAEERLPAVNITDDTHKEVVNDVYAWHGDDVYDVGYDASKPYKRTTVRPVFNTVSDGGLSVLFAPVREVYTPKPDTPTAYLYGRCWQNYIEEVYNAQNKTLEAYISLPRNVFDAVRNSPFVRIGDMLYIVTSIQGWGEHNTVVRCALRQITNINKIKS